MINRPGHVEVVRVSKQPEIPFSRRSIPTKAQAPTPPPVIISANFEDRGAPHLFWLCILHGLSLTHHLHLLLTMATLLPPPKRQKVYHGVPEPEPEPAKPSPHIVVQFVSEDDGQPLAPAVNLPANVSREGLEAIVNKLNTKVCFSFRYQRPMPRSRPGLSKSRLDQYRI